MKTVLTWLWLVPVPLCLGLDILAAFGLLTALTTVAATVVSAVVLIRTRLTTRTAAAVSPGAARLLLIVVAVLVAAGMSASLVLTGRKLKEMSVPNRSVMLGGVLAIVGFFVIPVVGLPVGFVLGLYLAELSRLKDPKVAWGSSWGSIKAIGIGTVIELGLALLAAITFGIGLLIHFM